MSDHQSLIKRVEGLRDDARGLAQRLHRSANINKTSVAGWIANMAGQLDALLPIITQAEESARREMRERAAGLCSEQAQDLRHDPRHRASACNLGMAIRTLPLKEEG